MAFIGYTIDTPVSSLCISQDDHDNLANNITYGDGIMFCSYMKSTGGYQQIFVAYSTDEGETWITEQVTTTSYDKYSSTCAVDTTGTGVHLYYSAKGYGATATQKSRESIVYQFRDALGAWSTPIVIHQCSDISYPMWYFTQPCIAVDSTNKVHLVCSYVYNYNPYFGGQMWLVAYILLNPTLGTSSNRAYFRYGYPVSTSGSQKSHRPNIHVDSYNNPHITFLCERPNSTYAVDSQTTVWISNWQQGALAGWPGIRAGGVNYYVCYGQISAGSNSHILCDKYKAAPVGGPESTTTPSWYHRASSCHAAGYFDSVNGYDYPHFVYSFNGSGGIYPAGTYYKWVDATGWHEELIYEVIPAYAINPSIALGPDGIIHTIVPDGNTIYGYRQRATPASAWSSKETVSSLYYPRQLVQVNPTQFPIEAAPCSPFIAVQYDSGYKLKYFKCVDVVTGYGYFM